MQDTKSRFSVLQTIHLHPALSSDEIGQLTGLPEFIAREAVGHLCEEGVIEYTRQEPGRARYCMAGKRDVILRYRFRLAERHAARGENREAIALLSWLRQGFRMDAEPASRCDSLLQACIQNELLAVFDREASPVSLSSLSQQFSLTQRDVLILVQPLLLRGLLQQNSTAFTFSPDAMLP